MTVVWISMYGKKNVIHKICVVCIYSYPLIYKYKREKEVSKWLVCLSIGEGVSRNI